MTCQRSVVLFHGPKTETESETVPESVSVSVSVSVSASVSESVSETEAVSVSDYYGPDATSVKVSASPGSRFASWSVHS